MPRAARPRLGRSASLALAGLLASACTTKEGKEGGSTSAAATKAEPSPELPADAAAFLAALLPLPDNADAIAIAYRIEGPALKGTMDVTLGPGGVRNDRWVLRSSSEGDAVLRVAGSRIVTHDVIWTAADGEPGSVIDNHLMGFARAYLARDAETQAKIMASIRTWQQTLGEQREQAGGERDEVLGVSCLRTRIAGQNVCMWEETGVLLDYEGSAFEIEAEQIDRQPQLVDGTFELPKSANKTPTVPTDAPDYEAILDAVAAGSYGSLSTLIYANVALPELK